MTLDHGLNDSFVRAARGATPEGQTETVWAIHTRYMDGGDEWWNVQPRPFTQKEVDDFRDSMHRMLGKKRPIHSAEQVSRQVTISAAPWVVE